MTIEICPVKEAEKKLNGLGQSEPNLHPFLPPPVGRMHFSLNPFYIFYECCGPKLFMQTMACFCCIVLFMMYASLCSSRIISCGGN